MSAIPSLFTPDILSAQLNKDQWLIGGNGLLSYSKSQELKFLSLQVIYLTYFSNMKNKYYIFYLELARADQSDLHIYAYLNVSHIPTAKLVEIFNINLEKDPFMLDGYFLKKSSYKKHKAYLSQTVGSMNLDHFEYTLRLYSAKYSDFRAKYKKTLLE